MIAVHDTLSRPGSRTIPADPGSRVGEELADLIGDRAGRDDSRMLHGSQGGFELADVDILVHMQLLGEDQLQHRRHQHRRDLMRMPAQQRLRDLHAQLVLGLRVPGDIERVHLDDPSLQLVPQRCHILDPFTAHWHCFPFWDR